jgi:hypothetical protein
MSIAEICAYSYKKTLEARDRLREARLQVALAAVFVCFLLFPGQPLFFKRI